MAIVTFPPSRSGRESLQPELVKHRRGCSAQNTTTTGRDCATGSKTCDLRDVRAWAKFFEDLADKVRFISVQYGDTNDEIAFARWRYGAEIYQDKSVDICNDLDAAAAQISAMDYVVSISTTAAHMAGGLGVPGWILLQKKPYPHWRAGQEICPWYPTLRPVRQPAAGDWASVLSPVAEELVTELDGIDDERPITR